MKPIDFKPDACCKRQSIATMDHALHSPDDWENPRFMVNRCCVHCFTHWAGEEGNVKRYTRAEWDAHIAASTT